LKYHSSEKKFELMIWLVMAIYP